MVTGTKEEMIPPMPPRAKRVSQLMRVCVPEPSSLSQRPETLERRMRFLIVRLPSLQGREDDVPVHRAPPSPAALGGPVVAYKPLPASRKKSPSASAPA